MIPDAIFVGLQAGEHLARALVGMDILFNPSARAA